MDERLRRLPAAQAPPGHHETAEPASRADDVLAFWFGRRDDPDHGRFREFWFRGPPEFDGLVRERFLADHEAAVAGALDALRESARGSLAMVLLLDQFPRNMFRGNARAFATDPHALAVADEALVRGFDRDLGTLQRLFLYLPFEHSESLDVQLQSVALIGGLDDHENTERSMQSAHRHLEIIERFGRFPHRNAVLGRPSTPEETAFLKEPNSSF
jgi:uncharacterized protein (DUF924 family)